VISILSIGLTNAWAKAKNYFGAESAGGVLGRRQRAPPQLGVLR